MLFEYVVVYVWVVMWYVIDYCGNVVVGEIVMGEIWVLDVFKGVWFDWYVWFLGVDGWVKVEVVMMWVLFDWVSGWLLWVWLEVVVLFF